MRRTACAAVLLSLLASAPAALGAQDLRLSDPVVMRAAAVSETPGGLVGSTATITITAAEDGSGHVFLDTFPLTEVDMQGSARLAARMAAQLAGKRLSDHDFFFVIRSGSTQIGGPSAGAALAVGAVAALQGWKVRDDALVTGTINPDGSVGPVGGVPEKAAAAAKVGVTRFLFPAGQQVVQRSDGARVNLTAYCAQELDIECLPVTDVRQAVGLMTDHEIIVPEVTGEVTGEAFVRRLEPLSRELVEQAQQRVEAARAEIAKVPESSGAAALRQRLASAQSLLDEAHASADNGSHYTASSLSFQAAVEAHGLIGLARYVRAEPGVVAAGLRGAEEAIERARADVERFVVTDASLFESAGAAQDRVVQAESMLAAARAAAQLGTAEGDLRAIEEAARAAERAETARWWLRLGENLPRGESVDPADLEGAARDTLTTSQEVVAYVGAVLRGGGDQLRAARDRLAQAQSAVERGYFAGAMFVALDAEVRASALLEVAAYGGVPPESAFEAKRVEAARAIQLARQRGFEPIAAQSVYEFSFAQEQPLERLAFLGMARVSANLAGLPGLASDPAPAETRFQGLPPRALAPPEWIAAAFALGVALGGGLGLAALLRDEDEAPPAPPAGAEPRLDGFRWEERARP